MAHDRDARSLPGGSLSDRCPRAQSTRRDGITVGPVPGLNSDGASAGIGLGIELREIRVFLTLAEELHFGRTAERLGFTTSHVSHTIRVLETRIGGRLFERTSRRVHVTPLGEQLAAELTRLYGELQGVLLHAREAATGVAGELRIGIYSSLSGGPHMTEIVRTFNSRHPGCEVKFIDTGLNRSYVDCLRDGEVDMFATRLPVGSPEIATGPILTREERVLVLAEDDPLAGRDSISYEEIADRAVSDVPAFPREMMDAFIPPVTPSGRILRRIANDSFGDTLMRVALGIQVHPTVRSFLDHHTHPGITSVPIRDLPPSETGLVWLTTNRSAKIEAFVRAAEDVLART
jgi:DNA-binding transcriptional LysR family regulator